MSPTVTTIHLSDCFVCETTYFMSGMSTPETVYYGGPTEEGRTAAKAAAEAEAERSRVLGPSLTFTVSCLDDYLHRKARSDRSDGALDERERW